MKKRDRRLTPKSTSLALGDQSSIDKMFDDWSSEAVPESTELKADTASAIFLKGEGTSKDNARIISNKNLKRKEERKKAKNNHRVPVLNPDGTPAMPTTNRRANKWLKEKKAKKVRNKLGIFQIQLLKEPSGRNKQDIVLTNDPGSAFTGIGVISKKAVLYGATLELPGYKAGSKPKIEKNRFGKKIEKYPNTIIEGMDKRRELRRSRRHRNCRRRLARWLNRSKSKIPPSILARKILELKVITELSKIYPISMNGFEDIKFNHFKDKEGVKGQFFSHVEVGKNWILEEMKKICEVKIIRGYETNIRRQQLELKKEGDKTVRSVDSHVNDCIAMGSIILGLGIETRNKFKFDTITRPKYSRRILHLEQPSKGGIRRKYGGSTTDWTNIRKGDYVEAIQGKKIFKGWVSGFIDDKRIISVSDFDWKRIGQFGESNIRLLDRNHGLLIERLYMEKERMEVCKYGTVQIGIDDAW
jgi:hypothetical protein